MLVWLVSVSCTQSDLTVETLSRHWVLRRVLDAQGNARRTTECVAGLRARHQLVGSGGLQVKPPERHFLRPGFRVTLNRWGRRSRSPCLFTSASASQCRSVVPSDTTGV